MRYLVVDLVDVVGDLDDDTSPGPLVELYVEGVAAERAEEHDHGSTITFVYPDEALAVEPTLRVGGWDFSLQPDILEQHVAADVEAARPVRMPARPASEIPFQSAFPTRVQPKHVKLPDDPVVAGLPSGGAIPVNAVSTKETSHYLAPRQTELRSEADWVPGWLLEFETYWEPLGWALDEWIDTLSIGPFEDTLQSIAEAATDASAQTGSVISAADRSGLQRESSGAVDESAKLSMESSATEKGLQLGLGMTSSTSAAVSVDPIATLARAVTGAVQLGYSSNAFSSDATTRGELKRTVATRLEQSTTQDRIQNTEALANSLGRLRESRRLRALRNLTVGGTMNLALFSVVRQWIVTTVQARTRPVVFIRIHELEVPFGPKDVFLHRAVLSSVLRDTSLSAALDSCAARFVPDAPGSSVTTPRDVDAHEPPSAPEVTVRRVVGRASVADPAKGQDSYVAVRVLFRHPDGEEDEPFEDRIEARGRGAEVEISIEVNRPLRLLAGWVFEFINPGARWDTRASLTSLDVDLEVSEPPGDISSKLKVSLPSTIEMSVRGPRYFARGVPATAPRAPEQTYLPRDEARLLAHLNASRAYYRLIIDLANDPASRFSQLSERAGGRPLPVDMRPVGVAGAHLAFLTDEDITSPGDDREPLRQLLSTPAGGTFMDVLKGKTDIPMPPDGVAWPSVAVAEKGSVPWPTPVQISPATASQLALANAPTQTAETPTAGTSELLAKLTDMLGSVEKLTASLKSVNGNAKDAVPATPAAADAKMETEAPATTPAEGTEGKSKEA